MAKKQFSPHQPKTISPKRLLGAAIALIAFFLLMTSVIGLGEKYFALRARGKDLAQQQVELTQKNKVLADTNAYLATPDGVEESLRERYNYIRPGEQMIVITPDTSADTAPKQSAVAHWWDELLEGLGLRTAPLQ